MSGQPVGADLLDRIDRSWRAANYLSVGQMYLRDNPLLKRPLVLTDLKRMLLGHWGTTPGQRGRDPMTARCDTAGNNGYMRIRISIY